jgi:hypothetical protein
VFPARSKPNSGPSPCTEYSSRPEPARAGRTGWRDWFGAVAVALLSDVLVIGARRRVVARLRTLDDRTLRAMWIRRGEALLSKESRWL